MVLYYFCGGGDEGAQIVFLSLLATCIFSNISLLIVLYLHKVMLCQQMAFKLGLLFMHLQNLDLRLINIF